MSRDQLAGRLLAAQARVDIEHIRSGDIAEGEWPRLTDAATTTAELPMWLQDPRG
jgi:replicative DNA helicase